MIFYGKDIKPCHIKQIGIKLVLAFQKAILPYVSKALKMYMPFYLVLSLYETTLK